MRNRTKLLKNSYGISLLEVLLSLSIIFVILLMATRYYQTTEASEKTNTAISMLNALTSAADDWYGTYKTFSALPPNIPDVSVNELINIGDLPDEFRNTANPWGGEIKISSKDGRSASIELTNIPQAECQNLVSIMQKRMAGSCSATGFEAIYPLQLKE